MSCTNLRTKRTLIGNSGLKKEPNTKQMLARYRTEGRETEQDGQQLDREGPAGRVRRHVERK